MIVRPILFVRSFFFLSRASCSRNCCSRGNSAKVVRDAMGRRDCGHDYIYAIVIIALLNARNNPRVWCVFRKTKSSSELIRLFTSQLLLLHIYMSLALGGRIMYIYIYLYIYTAAEHGERGFAHSFL